MCSGRRVPSKLHWCGDTEPSLEPSGKWLCPLQRGLGLSQRFSSGLLSSPSCWSFRLSFLFSPECFSSPDCSPQYCLYETPSVEVTTWDCPLIGPRLTHATWTAWLPTSRAGQQASAGTAQAAAIRSLLSSPLLSIPPRGELTQSVSHGHPSASDS